MVHTREQLRVEAAEAAEAAGHSMSALPGELLLRVLQLVMLQYGKWCWCGAVRGVSRMWRALHDRTCEDLCLRNGVTDEVMHALCVRLRALQTLGLPEVTSLTADGLRAVGGLTTLTFLNLYHCSVTDAVLRELRDLPELSTLYLNGCSLITDVGVRELRGLTDLKTLLLGHCTHVTDAGLQHCTSLTALTTLSLGGTSTTQAGRDALKAALPALTTYPR